MFRARTHTESAHNGQSNGSGFFLSFLFRLIILFFVAENGDLVFADALTEIANNFTGYECRHSTYYIQRRRRLCIISRFTSLTRNKTKACAIKTTSSLFRTFGIHTHHTTSSNTGSTHSRMKTEWEKSVCQEGPKRTRRRGRAEKSNLY